MNNRRFARTAGWLVLPCVVAAGLLACYQALHGPVC